VKKEDEKKSKLRTLKTKVATSPEQLIATDAGGTPTRTGQ